MAGYGLIVASYRIEKSSAKTKAGAIKDIFKRLKAGERIVCVDVSDEDLVSALDGLRRKGEQ